MPRAAPRSIASQLMTNHRLALCAAGAITMTAGGACGLSHNCREERDQSTRDEMLETLDQRKAREIESCNGDAECIASVRAFYQNIEQLIWEWYTARAANSFRSDDESRSIWNVIQSLLTGTLSVSMAVPAPPFVDQPGSVTGDGEIYLVTAIPIDVDPIAVNSGSTEVDSGAVSDTTTSAVAATTGVLNAVSSSSGGVVAAQHTTRLRGSFTIHFDGSTPYDADAYTFTYNFIVGNSKTLNGLTVRSISSGTASIDGTPLVLSLDQDVENSKLVIGSNGRGIMRLGGRIISTDPAYAEPFILPLRFYLPVEENSDGTLTIDTGPSVDLNIMLMREPAWFTDYNEDGQIDAADRAAFLVDHANQEIWTDLNGDDVSDAGDLIVYDGESARAAARLAFLATQGVD